MEREREYHKNWALRTAVVLFCLVMLTTGLLSGTLAKYRSGVDRGGDARVAYFDVSSDLNVDTVSLVMKPGDGDADSTAFSVSVTNSSEMSLYYEFSMDMEGNLPVTVVAVDETQLAKSSEAEQTWRTTAAVPQGGEAQTYQFYVYWPEEENNYKYAEGVESIRVTLQASQAQPTPSTETVESTQTAPSTETVESTQPVPSTDLTEIP